MAEIKIERKKRPVWPWILLIVILALLIWVIYESTGNQQEARLHQAPASAPVAAAQHAALSLPVSET